jgi:hypothetical protein
MNKMKASNYIIIAFVLGVICCTFFLEKPAIKQVDPINKTKKLDHFSVVVAEPGSTVFLETTRLASPYDYFSYKISDGNINNHAPIGSSFGVRNDTLFVFASSRGKEHEGDSFYCTGIKSVLAKEKSEVQLWNLQVDTLHVRLRHAKLRGNYGMSDKESKILILHADSSKIDLSNTEYEKINVQLNRSCMQLTSTPTLNCVITGNLKNLSSLAIIGRVNPAVSVEVDKTSYYNSQY